MVALLFTDLVGSTEVLDRLGDAGAEGVRKAHFELLREAVRARHGQEVKTLGDGLMAVFGSAVEAVACAVAVQEAARRHNEERPDEPLMIRVGLHVGEPVRDDDDYFGTAVVVARRLCDMAEGGQILASDLMRGLVGPRREHDFRPLGALPLKGLQEPVTAYEVSWDSSERGGPARPGAARSTPDGVLRTRLLPPRLPPGCVGRPELIAALEQGLEGRLVAVVAGAGYGKTTLLAQALHSTERIWIWCSCDARIGDPGALLAHVAEGIRERFPGFGTRVRLGGSAEEAVTELCNEVVETVSDDFVLVLDDVHLLPPAALDCLGMLVDHLPPNAHLALAGRAPLPFPLARLRALRVVEIGEDRLAFDLGETAELVRSLGMEPDDDTVAGLHHRTEGWAAGLILAAQSGDTSSAGLSAAQFDYLAEEILARQPPEVQEFLLDTSMLGRFSPELAAAVSGRADAADIARRLVRQHLFAVRLATEGEWYRYHHLLQAFLQGRLREREPERLRERHRRAATWWAAEGQPAEVVRHLLEAGEQEAAVDAIEPVAERMVLTSEGETLAGWLDAIPRPLWQDRPPIVLAQVGLLLHRARHEAAFAEAEEAIERLIDAGDHARAATAIVRLQQTMITAGTSPRRRWESGERYRDRIAPDAPMLPVVRILLATAYGYGCRFAEARDELAAALALPGAEGSEVHRGYAAVAGAFYVDFWTGRPLDALRSLEAAISDLEAIDPEDRLRFRLFARMLNTYLMLDLGRFEETLAFGETLREDFRRLGVEGLVLRAHNWIVWTALAGLGRWDELGAQFETPRQGPGEATCYAYRYLVPGRAPRRGSGECRWRSRRASRRRAARCAGSGSRSTSRGSCATSPWPHTRWASPRSPTSRPGMRSRRRPRSASPLASARAALVAAHVGEGDAGGDDHLARALALTGEHGFDDLWSGRERFAAPGLLARALAGGIGPPGVAERVLAGCGGQAVAEVLRPHRGRRAVGPRRGGRPRGQRP